MHLNSFKLVLGKLDEEAERRGFKIEGVQVFYNEPEEITQIRGFLADLHEPEVETGTST